MTRQKQPMIVVVMALALAILGTFGIDAARADESGNIAIDLVVAAASWVSTHANGIMATAYDRAPVLVTALAALLILPVTALAALLVQSMRARQHLAAGAAGRRDAGWTAPLQQPLPPAQPLAWLTHPTAGRTPLPAAQALVRIGRHEDNDICLPEATVHRHHALIHRTPDATFIITDVSGKTGNGIVVNGQRLNETRLESGDTIQLGDAIVTFESALPAYLAALQVSRRSEPRTNPG